MQATAIGFLLGLGHHVGLQALAGIIQAQKGMLRLHRLPTLHRLDEKGHLSVAHELSINCHTAI